MPVTMLEPDGRGTGSHVWFGKERRVLLFHRAAPVRVQQGLADRRGYRGDLRVPGHRRKSPGLQCTSRVSRHHRVNMTRVSVKKRWVVHRRHDTGSWGRGSGVGVAGGGVGVAGGGVGVDGGEDAAGGVGDPGEEEATGADGGSGASRARRW